MNLTASVALGLALRCAPGVAPETLLAVARAESGLNPWAIGVNHGGSPVAAPQSLPAAVMAATALAAQGANFDVGLAQINSANLSRLGLSLSDAFDPCANLAAAARILRDDFQSSSRRLAEPQAALRTAFSLYNTGDPLRGFRNGYVARVERAAVGGAAPPTALALHLDPAPPPFWDVFARARPVFVLTPAQEGAAP